MWFRDKTLAHDLSNFLLIVTGAMALYLLFFIFVNLRAKKETRIFSFLLKKHILFPGMLFTFFATATGAFSILKSHIQHDYYSWMMHALKIAVICFTGYLIIKILTVVKEVTYRNFKKENQVTLRHRKAKTQFNLIQRIFNIMIITAVIAGSLMTFDEVKNLGTTLLASAGVVGIILGFAAQKSLGALFAGIQIAISQPIRIGDVIIVEDEFGTIGEITLTYVIVHIWDGRRKIVPVNFFLEHSFENLTRKSPEVIAKVSIRTDYSVPVEEIRTEFKKWLDASPLWDRHAAGLLVTDADEKTIKLRATMSAKNSNDAWDLECLIREKLITYLNENYPHSLPKSRLVIKENFLLPNGAVQERSKTETKKTKNDL